MARILITGMTAAQTSPATAQANNSYAWRLLQRLESAGHDVTIATRGYYPEYDAVLVGIAPVLSMGANYGFAALNRLSSHFNSSNIVFFVDAPLPGQITASIKSILKNPDQMLKPIFAKRREAPQDHHDVEIYLGILSLLAEGDNWPPTLYPALPWSSSWPTGLPEGITGILPLNLDGMYPQGAFGAYKRLDYWVSNDPLSKWVGQITPTLSYGVAPIKVKKFSTYHQNLTRMAQMTGTLISPDKNGDVWWSPDILGSLNTRTPVATEWRISQELSEAWGTLPGAIEEMTAYEREQLAETQRIDYLSALPSPEEAINTLEWVLGV